MAQFPRLGRDQIRDLVRLERSPQVLDRIEFRCVRRQPLDRDAPLGRCDVIPDQPTAMDRGAIPDDQHLARNVPLEMPQELDHLGAFDAAGVDLEVEPPARQAANDREALPIEGLLEYRRLSTRSPSPSPRRARAQPAFVDEDDDSLLFCGFFFIAGHSTRFQYRMALSLRSTARRSGRWQLKPLASSSLQTCPG